MGARLPEGLEIRVVEENPDTVYLVLPASNSSLGAGDELSDRELETVSDGWESPGTETGRTCSYGSGCFR